FDGFDEIRNRILIGTLIGEKVLIYKGPARLGELSNHFPEIVVTECCRQRYFVAERPAGGRGVNRQIAGSGRRRKCARRSGDLRRTPEEKRCTEDKKGAGQ